MRLEALAFAPSLTARKEPERLTFGVKLKLPPVPVWVRASRRKLPPRRAYSRRTVWPFVRGVTAPLMRTESP